MSWPHVKFGKILKRVERFEDRDALKEYPFAGTYSFARGIFVGVAKPGSSFALPKVQRIKKGNFVYCKIMAWEGAFGIVPDKADNCVLSGAFVVYEIDRSQIEPRFLECFFKIAQNWSSIGSLSTGTNVRRRSLHPEQFENSEMPLPPVPEQRRIVARIEELSAKIEEACALRKQTSEEAEAVSLNHVGRLFSRLEEHHKPCVFGSFSPHVTSGPRNWAKHYEQGGLRFYRAQDISPGRTVLNNSKVFINPPPGDQGRSAMLQTGDLMLVITGATVGRVNVYREGLEPGFVSQHVAICRLPRDEVEPEFAAWGLRAPSGQTQLLGQRYGQGKPGLNLSNIRALSLPFPALAEQRRIVAYLEDLQSKVDSVKKLQEQSEKELNALMPSILSRAFAGEL